MTEKRFILKYSEYDCANGEIIQAEPYFIDTKEEYVDTDYFTIDGYPTMSDEQVLELLNKNEQLKQETYEMGKRIIELANEKRDLKDENEQLKRKKERYKLLSEIRDEKINNRILTIKEFIDNCSDDFVKNELEKLFYSEVKEYDLAKENRQLKHDYGQLQYEMSQIVEKYNELEKENEEK